MSLKEYLTNALQLEENYPLIKQRYLDVIDKCFGLEACTFMTMLTMRWNDEDMPVFNVLDQIGATPMVWSTQGGQPMLLRLENNGPKVQIPDAFVFQVTKESGSTMMNDCTTHFVLFTSEAKDLDFRRHAKIFAEIPYSSREFLELVLTARALVDDYHNLAIARMRDTSPSASSSSESHSAVASVTSSGSSYNSNTGVRTFQFSPGEANPISSAFETVSWSEPVAYRNHRIVQQAYGRVRQRYADLVEQSFGLDAYAFMLELALMWRAPSFNGFTTAAAVGA